MEPQTNKLKALLTDAVLQFCRQNSCFKDELLIQGTVCITSDSNSMFVAQISEIFNCSAPSTEEPTTEGQQISEDSTKISPKFHKESRLLKRKVLNISSKPVVRCGKQAKVMSSTEEELGVVKIEEHSSQVDNATDEKDQTDAVQPQSSFLGFGDESASAFSSLVQAGQLVMPSMYSYNQAEYIAAMNRDGAGVVNHDVITDDTSPAVVKAKEPTNYLQYVEKKTPDKYKCTLCDKEYSNRGSIYRHVDKHLGRSFVCDYCGSTFESHSGWTRHIRTIHAQHMNFSCDKCPRKFYQKNALDQHYSRIHGKEEVKLRREDT